MAWPSVRADTLPKTHAYPYRVDDGNFNRFSAQGTPGIKSRPRRATLEAQNRCAEIKLRAERKAGGVIPDAVSREGF